MVPVIVFRVGKDEYGVLPDDDLKVDALSWSGARVVPAGLIVVPTIGHQGLPLDAPHARAPLSDADPV
ncbi:hypothetical protein HGG75_25965 [Ochrobactrum pseudogrignonense]|nr:hypothetical protein [Brucella pseudogrignonensis]